MSGKKRRPTIGLLIQDLGFRLYQGAAEGARQHNANLLCFLGNTVKDPDPELCQSNVIYDLVDPNRLDALALWGGSGAAVGMYLDQAEMERFILKFAHLPMVNYERKIDGIPVFLTDVYQGMCEAVRHLIEIHQCHKIALIWGPAGHFETEERVRAYHDILAEYGLPENPRLISRPVLWTTGDGARAMEELLEDGTDSQEGGLVAGVDFDAVLTTDSSQAVGALGVLQQRGIHIPDDVVVLGFDERDDSRLTSPPLTTVKKPFYEVGKRLVETAIEAAAGKDIPVTIHVPTQLVVRRSCGCIDPAIVQASLDKTQASQEKFEIIINTRRASFLAEIASGMEAAVPDIDSVRIHKFVDTFITELSGKITGNFARALDDLLRQEMKAGDDGSTWQSMISAMQRRILPYLDGKKRAQADALWNQARIAIGASAQRLQAYQAYVSEKQVQILEEITTDLSVAFNLEALTNVLVEGLPRLGIPSCFLSLYENPQMSEHTHSEGDLPTAPEWSRLVLAYNDKGHIDLEKGGKLFPSRQLVPDGMLPQNRQFSYLVFPLHFNGEQLGFILLEVGPQQELIYKALITQIASALHGAALVKHMEERVIRLQAAAEVSRAASSILNTDELIQQSVNLIRERFNLYYVGLFLLDEEQRYAELKAGTGDAGNQMVFQGHRLEVGSNSMIGWCVANQKARIALDVGSEPVRFENPLLPATRSELALPLLARGAAIGALTVQSDREAAFTDNDITILQSMADQLANAIENTRLIRARQQAEDALRESELLYTSLVENMNFNVFRKDLGGRYTYANESFCKALNTSLVKLLGKTDYDFSPEEIAEKYRADDERVVKTGKPLEVIEEHVLTERIEADASKPTDLSSNVRYIQTLKAPVRNTQGEIVGIQGAFWDISDRWIAEKEGEHRAMQLQTASEISRAASSILDVNELTQQAVDLICNRFNLYYVGLFLIDQDGEATGEPGRWAILHAGTGDAGQKMLSQNHKLEVGGASMIGWCVAHNSAHIDLDTNNDSTEDKIDKDKKPSMVRFNNPLLPETRSELALPLASRGQVLGALSIQSTQRDAFTSDDIVVLQSMADQLANAIANARLYEQTQNALSEMETVYRRYLVRGWSDYSHTRKTSGYRKLENELTPLGTDLLPEVQQALLEPHPTTLKRPEQSQPTLVVPIKLRDNPIGAIGITANEAKHQWSEEEISVIETISEQFALAAENLRLLEETQRRAEREHLVSEITNQIRGSNDPQAILQTAANELRRALNARNARVLIESTGKLSER
jgi:GAF domain-containing protein/DNA-binding LacI/PurR family transcriptional regulator